MAMATKADLQTLQYSFQGEPFVNVTATAAVDTTTLAFAYQGQPLFGFGGVGSGGGGGAAAIHQFVIAT
jgi:hypothetical protein